MGSAMGSATCFQMTDTRRLPMQRVFSSPNPFGL